MRISHKDTDGKHDISCKRRLHGSVTTYLAIIMNGQSVMLGGRTPFISFIMIVKEEQS